MLDDKLRQETNSLLKGAVFLEIRECNLVFLNPEGVEILIGSTHDVWDYGDLSSDNLVIKCGEYVLDLPTKELYDEQDGI